MMILIDGTKMTKMMTKSFELFPTPVREYDLSEHTNLRDIILNKNSVSHQLVTGGTSSYGEYEYLLEEPEMKNLKRDIEECLHDYMVDFGDPDEKLKILNSWFNVMSGEGKLTEHNHSKSTVSGAYYVKLPENSTKLYFKSYWKYHKKFEVPIKEGHLYLFPSYLIHGGTKQTNEERIVVSFNTSVLF